MDIAETVVSFLNGYIWSFPEKAPLLVVLLLGAGFFMTGRLGFIQLRRLKHAFMVVAGKYDDPADEGDITHFQALSTALSATVGIGNIAGVATAIHYGGPGALFWMWLTALFGMALKYAECTLALHYRTFDDSGHAAGGPMYYMERGLGPRWKPLAALFAFAGIIASFGGGNMNQANTVAVSASSDFGAPENVVGLVCAFVVGVVILGGINRIAAVSSKLAPGMAVVYVLGALGVIAFNVGEVPAAFATIISSAFNPEASLGGSVAGTLSVTLLWGVKRGLFSNEAGQGSAPIAHAAAKTDEPVREGVVAMLGPLIDTLIICTMTGLAIITTGVWDEKFDSTLELADASIVVSADIGSEGNEAERLTAALDARGGASTTPISVEVRDGVQSTLSFIGRDGLVEEARLLDHHGDVWSGTLSFVPSTGKLLGDRSSHAVPESLGGKMLLNSSALTARAFKKGLSPLGDWGNYLVTLSVFLFALSTMISWSYYGDRCVVYLFGAKFVPYYRLVYTFMVFVGAVTALELVWAYGDLALGLMAFPNLIAILLLSPKVVEITKDYFSRLKE
ncbi:MAG: sodium:alanine symporter family protein [Deltaproteobacteria bacterium]|nr:sodium:alanine symporter family protein [Deltaproteobacteria bacterium]